MNSTRTATLLATFSCILAGCGGNTLELARIEGVVTMNGAPLSDAEVVFRPENGRPSFGKTDAEGHYVLEYTEEQQGALPGTHKVSISTFVERDQDSSDPVIQKGRKEGVPAKYNTKSTLTAQVEPSGSQTLNFDLEGPAGKTPAKPSGPSVAAGG